MHGDALSDIVLVTVGVYALWTWVNPAKGVSAEVELEWGAPGWAEGFFEVWIPIKPLTEF